MLGYCSIGSDTTEYTQYDHEDGDHRGEHRRVINLSNFICFRFYYYFINS